MSQKIKNKKGFTLVELLVVISIIGILATVAVPSLFKSIYKAKISDLEADYTSIKSALLSYYADNSKVPTEDIRPSNPIISNYVENISDKSPVGGEYTIIPKISREEIGAIDEKGKLININDPKEIEEINNKFSSFLQVDTVDNREYPQLTEEQFIKLSKDLGEGKVFVDGAYTFDDGLTSIYIGIIEK